MNPRQNQQRRLARGTFLRGTFFLRCAVVLALTVTSSRATPSNKAAFARHYDRFLGKDLNRCTTCHLPSTAKEPESLEEFPHNRFGDRLRAIGEE